MIMGMTPEEIKNNPTLRKYALHGLVRDVYRVMDWKDGCAWKMKPLGYIVTKGHAVKKDKDGGLYGMLLSPSTYTLMQWGC
tara:strand:- start:50 stop:292 length:243 start_codon:yes stop_codon:yes gene_type:complete